MQSYDVTIFTLIYNHKAYLPQLFAGMALQDPSVSVQWYIVDDASPDESLVDIQRLIETVPAHINAHVIAHQQNRGAMQSMIHAMSHPALGRYSMLLEGDDYLYPDFLRQTVNFLDAHTEYSAVHTGIDHYIIDDDRFIFDYWKTVGRNTGNGFTDEIPSGEIFDELLKHNFIQTCGFLCKTGLYYECLRVSEYLDIPYEYHFADYPLYLRLARNHKIGYIDKPLAVYRISNQGMNSNPANRAKMHYSTLRMMYDASHGRL